MKNLTKIAAAIGIIALSSQYSLAGYYVRADNGLNSVGYNFNGVTTTSLTNTLAAPVVTLTSSASLSAAQLHAITTSLDQTGTYNSNAEFGDVLHFAGAAAPFSVTVRMSVTGSVTGVRTISGGQYAGFAGFNGSSPGSGGTGFASANILSGPTGGEISLISVVGTANTTSIAASALAFDLSRVFSITLANPYLDLRTQLIAQPSASGTGMVQSDFTAALTIIVPAGITITSNSGVFGSAIPEPASVMLLGPAVVLLARRWRRGGIRPWGALAAQR